MQSDLFLNNLNINKKALGVYTQTSKQNFSNLQNQAFSVSEFNLALANMLNANFSNFWLYGEVINFANFKGHWYFSLRDKKSQINCVMFSSRNIFQSQPIKDGLFIYVKASANVYTAKGNLQLIVEGIKLQDEGDILKDLKALKEKLVKEGIFAKPKKTLPSFPKNIALITSAKGAVIHDITQVFEKSWRLVNIYNFDVQVQGKQAGNSICKAFNLIDKNFAKYDLILLARGGGADTELSVFDDENIVRAIYNARLPVLTGIGHATDSSLCDLVADYAATTPTAAAERLVENFNFYKNALAFNAQFLENWQKTFLHNHQNKLNFNIEKIKIAKSSLELNRVYLHEKNSILVLNLKQNFINKTKKLDYLCDKLKIKNLEQKLNNQAEKLNYLQTRLLNASPKKSLAAKQENISSIKTQLNAKADFAVTNSKQKLNFYAGLLDSLSPLKTMGRGFVFARNSKNKNIKSIQQLNINDEVKLSFADGKASCEIKQIEKF